MKMGKRWKNPKRLGKAERHDQIVDAALATFSRLGYRGATTRELARAAGVTEVTLFRHFPTKERLLGAVLEKYSILPVLRAQLHEMSQGGDTRGRLQHIGRRFLEILRERRDMIRLIFSEAAVNPKMARVLFRQGPGRFLDEVAKMLKNFCAQGEIRRVDFRLASRAFLGVFFSFMQLQEILFARERDTFNLRRAADVLSDLLWLGLRPEAGPRQKSRKGAGRS